MGVPKIVWEPDEKKIVESLIRKLNDMIIKDESNAKKAAIVLEQWLKKTKP